jgi:hypothetical protein
MAIKRADNEWVISACEVWRPGVYESERAARYAFRFTDGELTAAQAEANARHGGPGGVITFEQLQAMKRGRPPAAEA